MTLPHERFARTGGRGRWFPYAKFSHESHRMLDCAGCHAGAATSTLTSDVLMPQRDTCLTCHSRSTLGVRSDCLECHSYHDRGAEPTGLHGRMTVEQALEMTRPRP